MTATGMMTLEWVEVSRGFWRTTCSRFDLWRTAMGYYVAVDADTGFVHRGLWLESKAWCETRAGFVREG